MQIIHIIQIRNISALKDLDHHVGIDHADHLSAVCFGGLMNKHALGLECSL